MAQSKSRESCVPPQNIGGNEGDPKPAVRTRKRWSEVPFGDRWRAVLIRLPRYIPKKALRLLVPEGPHPKTVDIPSRFQNHKIPLWIFLPPSNVDKSARFDDNSSNNGLEDVGKRTVPVHIDFHGGNFIMGGSLEQASFCARISREKGCIVIGVDYCIRPTYEYPSALEDAEDVIRAVLDSARSTNAGRILYQAISQVSMPGRLNHRRRANTLAREELLVDPKRLSLSGFSSGGNLALNLVLSTSNTSSPSLPKARERDESAVPTIPLDHNTTKREDQD